MKNYLSMPILTLSVAGLAAVFASGQAFAAVPECELQADTAWMEQDDFQEKVETMGYTINDLVVTDGNCYQLTGLNKDGQGVTAFFNPQTGDVVQEDIAQ